MKKAPRHSSETASEVKDRVLFERAGSGSRPVDTKTLTGTRWHGIACGECVSFQGCIKWKWIKELEFSESVVKVLEQSIN